MAVIKAERPPQASLTENKKPWYDGTAEKANKGLLSVLRVVGLSIFLIASLIIIIGSIFFFSEMGDLTGTSSEGDSSGTANLSDSKDCNTVGIFVHGGIVAYISPENFDSEGNQTSDETASENVAFQIEQAEKDDQIKAIIIEIDSYGGMPVAGEEIANALLSAKKPTVAVVRSAGVSAAYWAATGAKRIFASKNSDVGSIGVTMSYVDMASLNKTEGYTYNQLSSGKFKDTGSLDKALTDEEKKLLMRDVNIIHQNFIQVVAANRKLDAAKVAALADGSTMLGDMALLNGLIDQIGGEAEAKEYLKGIIGEDVDICW